MRTAFALRIISGKNIYNFGAQERLRTLLCSIFTEGVTPSVISLCSMPAPPRGRLGAMPETLPPPPKAVPLRADFPRPGEDVA